MMSPVVHERGSHRGIVLHLDEVAVRIVLVFLAAPSEKHGGGDDEGRKQDDVDNCFRTHTPTPVVS